MFVIVVWVVEFSLRWGKVGLVYSFLLVGIGFFWSWVDFIFGCIGGRKGDDFLLIFNSRFSLLVFVVLSLFLECGFD